MTDIIIDPRPEAPRSGLIYAAMNALQADIEPIAKNQRNQDQKFDFRGIDDVYGALHPLLVKHGVLVVPFVTEMRTEEYQTTRGTTMHRTMLIVEHRFTAADGSYLPCVTVGESADASDKSAAKAMSVAYKYAIFETFCIPVEDDADAGSPGGPSKPNRQGVKTGGPRISKIQGDDIRAAAGAAENELALEPGIVMRELAKKYEFTRLGAIPRASFQDVLGDAKAPQSLLGMEAARDGGSNRDDGSAGTTGGDDSGTEGGKREAPEGGDGPA